MLGFCLFSVKLRKQRFRHESRNRRASGMGSALITSIYYQRLIVHTVARGVIQYGIGRMLQQFENLKRLREKAIYFLRPPFFRIFCLEMFLACGIQ